MSSAKQSTRPKSVAKKAADVAAAEAVKSGTTAKKATFIENTPAPAPTPAKAAPSPAPAAVAPAKTKRQEFLEGMLAFDIEEISVFRALLDERPGYRLSAVPSADNLRNEYKNLVNNADKESGITMDALVYWFGMAQYLIKEFASDVSEAARVRTLKLGNAPFAANEAETSDLFAPEGAVDADLKYVIQAQDIRCALVEDVELRRLLLQANDMSTHQGALFSKPSSLKPDSRKDLLEKSKKYLERTVQDETFLASLNELKKKRASSGNGPKRQKKQKADDTAPTDTAVAAEENGDKESEAPVGADGNAQEEEEEENGEGENADDS